MILESSRLILRPYTLSDWKNIHEYGQSEEFSKYEVWGPNSEEDSKNFVQDCIQKNRQIDQYEYEFAITLKSNKRLVGGCSLRRVCKKSCAANFGYAVNPTYQNQGIATEATRLLLDYAFNKLNLILVYAMCHVDNIASQKVIEKCQMHEVGTIKNHLKFKDRSTADSFRFEITQNQYRSSNLFNT